MGTLIADFKECASCHEIVPAKYVRKHAKNCVWCDYKDPKKRARARHFDLRKRAGSKVTIDSDEFVKWYMGQGDRCAYCGLTFSELKTLKIKHGGGYYVSWDIDRCDPSRPYEPGNLALACFVCNMAKGDTLSPAEAQVIGRAVRQIWDGRLGEPQLQ